MTGNITDGRVLICSAVLSKNNDKWACSQRANQNGEIFLII